MGNVICPKTRSGKQETVAGCGTRTRMNLFEETTSLNRYDKWRTSFGLTPDRLLARQCRIQYNSVKRIIFKERAIDYSNYPLFGVSMDWTLFPGMDDNLKESAIRIFLVISEMNDLFFAPLLPSFIVILLYHLSEEEVYCTISSILDHPDLRMKYLICNQRYFEAFLESIPSINKKHANAVNLHFNENHSSVYGYLVRTWMSSFLVASIRWEFFTRVVDAFACSGIWLFSSLFISFCNTHGQNGIFEAKQMNEEEYILCIQSFLQDFEEDTIEGLLLENSETICNEDSAVRIRMDMMQRQIDEGENIMNICRYHVYCVIGPARLLTIPLCKEIMRYLPVRIQSLDPHLLFTTLIHGYNLVQLIERSETIKPTLLLLQIEHTGNIIGLYREDRWSRRKESHGIPDTILFLIEFFYRDGQEITEIKKWSGLTSDQFVAGLEQPIPYVYVRSPERYLMIGAGGRKGISFYCSHDFSKAYSQQSDVYQNSALCDQEFFSISNVELYDFYSGGTKLIVCLIMKHVLIIVKNGI